MAGGRGESGLGSLFDSPGLPGMQYRVVVQLAVQNLAIRFELADQAGLTGSGYGSGKAVVGDVDESDESFAVRGYGIWGSDGRSPGEGSGRPRKGSQHKLPRDNSGRPLVLDEGQVES